MRDSGNKNLCLTVDDICGLMDITLHGIEGLSRNKTIAELVNNLARSIVARVVIDENGAIVPREADLSVKPT